MECFEIKKSKIDKLLPFKFKSKHVSIYKYLQILTNLYRNRMPENNGTSKGPCCDS